MTSPARKDRLAKARAGRTAQLAGLQRGRHTIPCIRCGEPRPGRKFSRRVMVCNLCWSDMTTVERINIRGFASRMG